MLWLPTKWDSTATWYCVIPSMHCRNQDSLWVTQLILVTDGWQEKTFRDRLTRLLWHQHWLRRGNQQVGVSFGAKFWWNLQSFPCKKTGILYELSKLCVVKMWVCCTWSSCKSVCSRKSRFRWRALTIFFILPEQVLNITKWGRVTCNHWKRWMPDRSPFSRKLS